MAHGSIVPKAPHEFPRRILLATIGLAPQIITETLFALVAMGRSPFVPGEIHIITTVEGRHRIQLQLLDPSTAMLARFAREFDAPSLAGALTPERIHIIVGPDGQPLDDITADGHNAAMADLITSVVRDLTRDETAALHVSIAGGRKAMGFLLGYAISLYGRPQDRLSHVLVDPPFESHPEFFYPPKTPRVLMTNDKRPRPINTADASVTLADIPFVRLRQGMHQDLLDGRGSYSETVRRMQETFANPRLVVDVPHQRLLAGGVMVELTPLQFAFYAWLADRRRAQEGGDGAAHWTTMDPEPLLAIYSQLPEITEAKIEMQRARWAGGIPATPFEQLKSKINSELHRRLGSISVAYQVKRRGTIMGTQYETVGLDLAPEQIAFEPIVMSDARDDAVDA